MQSKIVFNLESEILNDRNYIAFDTENNGLEDSSQFIRISAVKVRKGMVVDTFNQLIKPANDLPKIVEETIKINNEMLQNKPNEQQVISDFIRWIGKDILVTYNAKFEIKYLNLAIVRAKLTKPENPIIDILEIFRKTSTEDSNSIQNIAKKNNIKYKREISRELIIKEIYEKYISILSSINIYDLSQ